MSFTPKKEWPILKPNVHMLKPSSRNIMERTDNIKKGFKRTGSSYEEITPIKQKHLSIATDINLQPSSTKNLANNRLRKLKNFIQEDLKSRNTKCHMTNISTQISRENKRNEISETFESHDFKDTRTSLQNEYNKLVQDGDTSSSNVVQDQTNINLNSSSRSQSFRKNIANERLHNIKKRLSDDGQNKCTSVVSSENQTKIITSNFKNPYCSGTDIKNKRVTGVKRHINSVADSSNRDEDDGKPPSKKVASAPNVTAKDNSLSSSNMNKSKTKIHSSISMQTISTMKDKSISKCNIGCDNTKRLSTNINFKEIAVQRKLSNRETVQDSKFNNSSTNYTVSPKQSTTEKLSTNYKRNFPQSSPLPDIRGDSFSSKMAMTASWVRNHQDLSLSSTGDKSVESTENSLNLSRDLLIKENFHDETEDMEWTNAEPDNDIKMDRNMQKDKSKEGEAIIKDPEKLKDVCIVVDTNIFISGVSKIKDIINLKIAGLSQPVIYIPWMVITELDYMKDSCSDSKLKKNITKSIKFINTALSENNPRILEIFLGQTVFDMEKQKYVGQSPDDKIISCCLQIAEKYETVILLSNDINLKNKAMINNIMACSSNEIMMRIISKLAKNTKSQKILNKMSILCTSVICECAKEAYGDAWNKMNMLSCPPWSLLECLKRFQKYWGSVFKEKLLKQFTKTTESLLNFLEINKIIYDDSDEFIEFMKLCVTLCIFLKDIEECRGFVENTLNDITKVS